MYSSTLSLTSALDWGGGGKRHAPAALPHGITRYPLHSRLDRNQERSGPVRKILPQPGFDSRTVQPEASRNTDYAFCALMYLPCLLFIWRRCKMLRLQRNESFSIITEQWTTRCSTSLEVLIWIYLKELRERVKSFGKDRRKRNMLVKCEDYVVFWWMTKPTRSTGFQRYWQGNTVVRWAKRLPGSPCLLQTPHGLSWER
jgi:hypothetical protein